MKTTILIDVNSLAIKDVDFTTQNSWSYTTETLSRFEYINGGAAKNLISRISQ